MLRAIDPTTGELLHEYPTLSPPERETAIEAAFEAYRQWRDYSFSQRGQVLKDVAAIMRDEVDQLALLMTQEIGKPIKEARGEVEKAAWCAEHYAERAESYLAPVSIASDARNSYVQYLPLGPVLGILPWNAPFWLAFRFCAPALMAGNTCLMKHDSHVPACARAIADIFQRVDAPPHILQNLPLKTEEVAQVIQHPRIQAVSFTGSDRAGSLVAATAAAQIKPAVLELGGSDPAIVLADADIDKAAKTLALSRIINAGQSCIAAKRMIVETDVYDTFVEKLTQQLSALNIGDPREESTDVGPIAREELRANLARQVDETIAAGARCLLGGTTPDGPGFFYPVTLLVDVENHMTACREETFGPVAVVERADNAEHALALANDTPYGLAASIWTDSHRGEAMAANLETGQVTINGLVKTDPRLPSGGVKKSGYGRELGPHGILEFTNTQQVWIGS